MVVVIEFAHSLVFTEERIPRKRHTKRYVCREDRYMTERSVLTENDAQRKDDCTEGEYT